MPSAGFSTLMMATTTQSAISSLQQPGTAAAGISSSTAMSVSSLPSNANGNGNNNNNSNKNNNYNNSNKNQNEPSKIKSDFGVQGKTELPTQTNKVAVAANSLTNSQQQQHRQPQQQQPAKSDMKQQQQQRQNAVASASNKKCIDMEKLPSATLSNVANQQQQQQQQEPKQQQQCIAESAAVLEKTSQISHTVASTSQTQLTNGNNNNNNSTNSRQTEGNVKNERDREKIVVKTEESVAENNRATVAAAVDVVESTPLSKTVEEKEVAIPLQIGNAVAAALQPQNKTTGNNNNNNSLNSNTDAHIKNECDQGNNVIIKTEKFAADNNKIGASVESATKNTTEGEERKDDVGASSSSDNFMFSKPRPVLLSAVNPHIVCSLCHGYLIDATTIVECLHSFCHSCLIKHLRTEQYCPRCEMMINTAKPNIKPDTTLQAIVYKLVPGLYEKELMRKRAFYKDRPREAAMATPEQRGEDTEHLIFSPSDNMSLSLEYADMDELSSSGSDRDYGELLNPRYLQCPAMYTVALLKKFVHGKFDIDAGRFNIDIMYKVKTIVLLDHYTLMDVAYIYTWKRDAPMRFYFRVKECLKPLVRTRKAAAAIVTAKSETCVSHKTHLGIMTVVHAGPPSMSPNDTDIKVETEAESSVSAAQPSKLETPPSAAVDLSRPLPSPTAVSPILNGILSCSDKLKVLPYKSFKEEQQVEAKHDNDKNKEKEKEKKDIPRASLPPPAYNNRGERKVENIKLKIDLSKQNSVTIINMSDPDRKETTTKPVRYEREWKVKTKKDKEGSLKCSPNSERKGKLGGPQTVPPLTIKAERISPLAKLNALSIKSSANSAPKDPLAATEDEQKSQFLKSFALTPIKDIKIESPEKTTTKTASPSHTPQSPKHIKMSYEIAKDLMKIPKSVLFKTPTPSKRKSKDPIKAISAKKLKTSPPLSANDFRIKLPSSPNNNMPNANAANVSKKSPSANDKPLMPPPASIPIMRPPTNPAKKSAKLPHKFAAPGSLTPRPMNHGVQMAPPGNRTPIAKRYQPILPKGLRPNPFANIPSDVNKILKDAGTEIKSVGSESSAPKVYGPKPESTCMGPPPNPTQSQQAKPTQSSTHRVTSTANKAANSGKPNNYLNLALSNASKLKGNEVPPGCRTPMYSPNSPIYSPSSPQYMSNYNIPTMPTYKYTPKPSGVNNSYLQNVLGSNSQLASLFPAPPTKRDTSPSQSPQSAGNGSLKSDPQPKRVYPFARSPSPVDDPPEKQLKVKSLLTSCNINIPSSLSITITREDGEYQSSNASHPKHKSPVNNYIEILKLPDQPAEHSEPHNRRASPPAPKHMPPAMPASLKKDLADRKPIPSPQHLIAQKMGALPQTATAATVASKAAATTSGVSGVAKPQMAHTTGSSNSNNMCKPPASHNPKGGMNPLATNATASAAAAAKLVPPHQKPLPTPSAAARTQAQKAYQAPVVAQNASMQMDKKTPSPEKRPRSDDQLSPPVSDNAKSPKSPNTTADVAAAQAGKKFRHILPRQNPAPIPEVIPPKVTTANVIGTYSSPSGVAVKIHANASKKVTPPAKKSPSSTQQQHQQLSKSQSPLPHSAPNSSSAVKLSTATTITTASKSPTTSSTVTVSSNHGVMHKSNSKSTIPPALSSPNALNKLVSHSQSLPHPSLPTVLPPSLPHPMQAMAAAAAAAGISNLSPHLGVAAAAAASAAGQNSDLSKFLKDNMLRAQVQAAAAAANPASNMFYSYAANAAAAAQMNPYTPAMYNYQHAYIMEQLTRMQRHEALNEYMQKLKSDLDSKTAAALLHQSSSNDLQAKSAAVSMATPSSAAKLPAKTTTTTTIATPATNATISSSGSNAPKASINNNNNKNAASKTK